MPGFFRNFAANHFFRKNMKKLLYILICSLMAYGCHTTPEGISEDEAMRFLYASMALPDSTDYSETFYREQVRTTLQARQEMPWGPSIPKREWMHFVLPIRVNNENLDTFRLAMYEELKARVEGMTMEEAALEVNHWCHEHVTYQPSDARTSSPLATMRSAIGRCGEESTFTVAALRTIGIPARQVYTPRWAHTDDNHAWVEAWIEGEWKFMGACEPEPVLNLGWFNAPASRAMLMHTKAIGNYDGPERVMTRTACYTEIDVTDTYAPTTVIQVEVTDADGRPTPATVQFRLYNYAEFYPLNTKQTDEEGKCDFKAGHGTLLVWATDNHRFGFETVQVESEASPVKVKLIHDIATAQQQSPETYAFDVIPPAERNTVPSMTDEQVERNKQRLAYEDSLRQAYTATFYHEGQRPKDEEAFLLKARGNHATLTAFLDQSDDHAKAMHILSLLSDKDLRDVTLDVLTDNYTYAASDAPDVLQQRISNEMLTPYRQALLNAIPKADAERFRADASLLEKWICDNITIDNEHNPLQLCMHPISIWKAKRCDSHSRDIFFVAMARTLGIEARLNEVTNTVEYKTDGCWRSAFASNEESKATDDGTLRLAYQPTDVLSDPHYYTHFTLSLIEDGIPTLLNFPESATWNDTFAQGVQLPAGQYILTTGTRLASGSVLSQMTFFTITTGQDTEVALTLRQTTDDVQIIGNFGSETRYSPIVVFQNEGVSIAGMEPVDFLSADILPETSILSTTGRGYYAIGLLSVGTEPTNHALNDLSAVKDELERWGRPILLIVNDLDEAARIQEDFPNLPSTVHFGTDTTGKIQEGMHHAVQATPATRLPIFLIADTFDRVVFMRQGYTIGLGDQMLKISRKL